MSKTGSSVSLAIDAGDVHVTLTISSDAKVSIQTFDTPVESVMLESLSSDLAIGDKVPPQPEVKVVGKMTKRITRKDPEFATLVSNQNPDIVFKDEEHDASDRMMTQKLSDRLDALAKLVKKEWSGTKLRVTEAWDDNNEHGTNSIHYEGRAADLTTHPVDPSKYGRVARLAVDAGLEWVFYEDASHVHVSMSK